ncbi:MAG: hypothetical protein ACLR4Z_06465 [Butyricicoccaceae bacterium]
MRCSTSTIYVLGTVFVADSARAERLHHRARLAPAVAMKTVVIGAVLNAVLLTRCSSSCCTWACAAPGGWRPFSRRR